MKNIIAGIADFALFFFMWLVVGIHWVVAFFLSTIIVIAVWWLLEIVVWYWPTDYKQ